MVSVSRFILPSIYSSPRMQYRSRPYPFVCNIFGLGTLCWRETKNVRLSVAKITRLNLNGFWKTFFCLWKVIESDVLSSKISKFDQVFPKLRQKKWCKYFATPISISFQFILHSSLFNIEELHFHFGPAKFLNIKI